MSKLCYGWFKKYYHKDSFKSTPGGLVNVRIGKFWKRRAAWKPCKISLSEEVSHRRG
jgi:hypothetical protein